MVGVVRVEFKIMLKLLGFPLYTHMKEIHVYTVLPETRILS